MSQPAVPTAHPYHHGDLPASLRAVAADLVAERGASNFSLREVARRAGVSHAAPAHHFGNARGLLTSLAAEGFEALADQLEAAVAGVDDAATRLQRCGLAYVRAASTRPGHYAVMMDQALLDEDDEQCLMSSMRAYAALQATIEAIRAQLNPALDVESAATLAWASMHGLVELGPKLQRVADLTDAEAVPVEDLVARFTPLLIDGFRAR